MRAKPEYTRSYAIQYSGYIPIVSCPAPDYTQNALMEDLRDKYNYKERLDFQVVLNDMRPYLMAVLKYRSGDKCEICHQNAPEYDIHHLLYNPKITINELQLLCIPCHKAITDYRRMDYR
jgi:hypothetical protein